MAILKKCKNAFENVTERLDIEMFVDYLEAGNHQMHCR